MSSSDGFGGSAYDHLLVQGAAGFTPDRVNTHGYQQETENGLTKKKRNKNRSSGSANTGVQVASGSKTVDKSSGFLPKNGRKTNGQMHNNNNNNNNHNNNTNPRHSSQGDFEVLGEKDDIDTRGIAEFNGNYNGLHSPRSGATGTWNGKQDNTNTKTVLDPSSIVERLIHLRDCIKQVTSIMHSLEKTDEPVTGKQINNLNQMLQMLRTEEQENMELLQQVLVCREESERSSASNSAQNDLSPVQPPVSPTRRRNNPVHQDAIENDNEDPQGDLLLRMLDSQKKFASIQEQQASLLRLQKKAEEKLAAARAFHEHIVQSSFAAAAAAAGVTGSVSSNLSTSSVSSNSSTGSGGGGGGHSGHPNPLILQDTDLCEDDGSVNALVLHGNVDDIEEDLLVGNKPPLVPPRKEESRATPAFDLEDIQKRILALRDLQMDRQSQCEQLEEIGLVAGPPRSLSTEVLTREQAHRATDRQRQHLEGKLRQLQEKKQQMNSLLAELSTLHTCAQSSLDDQLELPASPSPASFASPVNSGSHKIKATSDVGETQRKLKQLEEMKNTLKTLQRLTENIEQVDNSLNKEDVAPPPPPTRGRSQGYSDSIISMPSLKPDNLRRDCATAGASAQFPARRHYEAEGRANEDADTQAVGAGAVGPQNSNGLLTVMSPSNGNVNGLSRSTSGASDYQSIDQKVKKLADAQSKLRQLKMLLNVMQQQHQSYQDAGEQADDLPALLSTLQQTELSSPTHGNSTASPVDNHEDLGEESEDSGVSADQGKGNQTDLEVVLETAKSQRQLKLDLDALLQERRHLESMQELSSLQLQIGNLSGSRTALGPGASSGDSLNNSRDRSSGEGGSLLKSRAGSQLASSFTSNEMGRQDNLYRENGVHRSEAKTLNSQANNPVQQSKPRSRSRTSASPTNMSSNQVNHNNNTLGGGQNGSFSELNDQLNYNLALRDELRAQKAVLQELLKQERSKQMGFSQNQDTQSQGESTGKTEKSEVVSIQCPSTVAASPVDNQEAVAIAHWGMLGHSIDETPSYSASENLQGFEEQHQSGLSSPWQKNFSSPAQEDLSPFQQMGHLNFPRRTGPRLPPPPTFPHPHQQHHHPQQVSQEQPQLQQQQQQQQQQQPQQMHPVWPQQCQSQWDQLSRHFQKQAESTHALCQAVLREQQAMMLMANAPNPTSGSSSTASSAGLASNGGAPGDILSSHVQQLQQQQQLLFSLSHCFHLLCLQQLQVTQIHSAWAIQSGNPVPSHSELAPSPFSYQAISEPLTSGYSYNSQWTGSGSSKPSSTTPQSVAYYPASGLPFPYQPMSSSAYNIISGDDNTSVSSGNSLAGRGAPETLNNQVPPRSRTNNFLDNFRSNSRQNLLSNKCNEPQFQQKIKLGTPCTTAAPPAGSHLRSSFSFSSLPGDESAFPSQSSLTRQNVSSDGGSHFGGVRPRTKKPNFSQEKSNSLSHGLSNVSVPSSHQGQHITGSRGHPLFSPVSGLYQFGENAHKARRAKDFVPPPPPPLSKPFAPVPMPNGTQSDSTIQESIYSEVGQLLSQWEEQPTVLHDLLDQIRAFQISQQVQAQQQQQHPAQRSNLLDFSNASSDRSEEGSLPTCHSKLSKQSASFGSKCLKPHNTVPTSSQPQQQQQQQQERPQMVTSSGLTSSHRHSQLYSAEQHKNQEPVLSGQVSQRQSTSGMESIPEGYSMTAIKSEKPDIVSQLRSGLGSEAATNNVSEESCSLTSSVSSPASSSSSSHNNNNNSRGTPFNCSSHQQSEDYRAAPDGGAALPPSPPLQLSQSAPPASLLHPSAPPPILHGGPGSSAKFPEDCGSYLYDAEGETEAETEDDDTKDLAEADQSAGQISINHGLRDIVIDGSVRSGSSSLSLATGGAGVNEGAEGGEDLGTLSTEIVSTGSNSSTNPCCSCPLVPAANGTLDSNSCEHSCLSSSAHASAPDLDIDELALDDVPIKLETLSPEELRRQMLEEQASNSLLGEMLSDPHSVQLAPDSESGLTHSGSF